jgi:hypothetical protein
VKPSTILKDFSSVFREKYVLTDTVKIDNTAIRKMNKKGYFLSRFIQQRDFDSFVSYSYFYVF